jgi:hypothetical protein
MLASLGHGDLSVLFVVLGILCLAGAAYCAYIERIAAAAMLLIVGLVVLFVL